MILIILTTILFCTTCTIIISPTYAEDIPPSENEKLYGIDKEYKSPQIKVNSKNIHEITPDSKPCDNQILKYSTYNKYTKNYYTILSYMMKFEKSGGGTLKLKKGTYTITNTIPVPSNVNIMLDDGVIIKKGLKTGTSKFGASTSIFQLIPPSKLQKKSAYGKYDGVSNVNIIGKGTSTIDLMHIKDHLAIVCGHNRNVNIQGITFKNLNGGHFLEIAATNKMTITNCKFLGSKPSAGLNKEAINIDTPDINTKGFNNIWSKQDKTPNNNILIENNVFKDVDRAIGTHKYSQNKHNGKYVEHKGQIYHTQIVIRNNDISKTRSDPIRLLNWKDSKIINNNIYNIPRNSKDYRGVLATGVNITIKYNRFSNMNRPVQFFPVKNPGAGSIYTVTYNNLNKQNENDLRYNLCSNVAEPFTRISNVYNYFMYAKQIHMFV